MYTDLDLARRSEKWFPCHLVNFLKGSFLKGKAMSPTKFCECGCGTPTQIATKTTTKRNQKKGEPLRFISGHNTRLLSSEEQSRRASFNDPRKQRYSGSRLNYIKYYGRHLHRVIAEQKLGRPLVAGEIVHHKDGDKWNNNPDNLEIMTQAEHVRIHNRQRWHGDCLDENA